MSHLDSKGRRARRRERTLVLSRRRREEHLARSHPESRVPCVCDLAGTYFAKRSVFGCNCRKRRKGRPKVAAGMCNLGARDRVYDWRHEARDLRVATLAGRLVTDDAPSRVWLRAKHGPKVYTIEKCALDRAGMPRGDWSVHRRYRTSDARDRALLALRRNRGPRVDFRAGPGSAPTAQ